MSGVAIPSSRKRPNISVATSGQRSGWRLGWPRRRAYSWRPVGGAAQDQPGARAGGTGAPIERRHVVKALATRSQKDVAAAERDLFQGLEAIGREARTDHGDGADAAPWQLSQAAIGGRREPAVGAEARLETQTPIARRQVERGRELYRGLATLIAIAVATGHVRLRNAVKRHQHMPAASVQAPMIAETGGERADVVRLGMVAGDVAQLGQRSPCAQRSRHLVVDGAGGAAAALRKQRQHDPPAHAGG